LTGRILESCPELRIRFSSIDPGDLDHALVNLVTREERVCPHLHLPVQSGSSSVLERMRRNYHREDYLATVRRVRAGKRRIEVTTDIIVGFPGETEQEFRSTLSLVKQCRFLKVHAFRYSARPGTPAADYSGQLAPELKKERLNRLLETASNEREKRLTRMLRRTLEVLVERELVPGQFVGRAGNYAPVLLAGKGIEVGKIYFAKVNGIKDDMLVGAKVTGSR
jgi:MiaB/RimO family radical SAM methylthiotransferase